MILRVNGRDAASLPLADRAGDAFRRRPVSMPLSSLRPGLNHVALVAELGTAADRTCDATATVAAAGGGLGSLGGKAGKRFALLDTTTVELPCPTPRRPTITTTRAPCACRRRGGRRPEPAMRLTLATLLLMASSPA